MKRILSFLLSCIMVMVAIAAEKPVITTYTYQGMYLYSMSDNGQWGLIFGSEECTNSPMIVNLKTKQVTPLQGEADIMANGVCTAHDVTDDGNIVVGSYKGHPAFLNRGTGLWTELGTQPGELMSVTPDGKYAVGHTNAYGTNDNSYEIGWPTSQSPIIYDLTISKAVELGSFSVPTTSPKGEAAPYNRFLCISPDGRYIMGRQMTDSQYFGYVIDRTKSGAAARTFIGYKTTNEGISYEPVIPTLLFVEPMNMSPNGQWICADAYIVEGTGNEYGAVMRYNIATGQTDCYMGTTDDQTMLAGCIDNNGNVYAATPQNSPVREMYVRNGKYWHALRSVLSQHYSIDYAAATGYDNTGTPLSISADGRTIISMVDPQFGQNICVQMNESLIDICSQLNLLDVYTTQPVAGAVFSKLSQIKITFDRDVEVVGAQNAATFGEWTSLSGNGLYVDPTDSKSVIAAFRTRSLEQGRSYTFRLPAGTIAIKGDRERTNAEITVSYNGRQDVAMQPTAVYPESGSTLTKIDNVSSPVQLTFSCNVAVTDTATAALYIDGGQKVCALTVAYLNNSVALYPATTQYLYKDIKYRVVLAEGSVTDVSGAGANHEYSISYTGNYEREVSTDDVIVFQDDFNNVASSLSKWILYEGDHGNPDPEVSETFEFDADNTPWNFSIHDSQESTDYCAASHSIYVPAVQAEDWMLTPQLYIPDATCTLSFDAQNYGAEDRLKVLVWATPDVITSMTDELAENMLMHGTVVFDEQIPADDEPEKLEGGWTHYTVDLSAYAGKTVYICFGNQNYGQSMLFVDNVLVERNMNFLLTLSNKQSVVNEQTILIAGKVVANDDDKVFSSIAITLRDAAGKEIDHLSAGSLHLAKGDSYAFAFQKPLPLTVGEVNRFTLDVKLDDITSTVSSSIKDLAFEPTKRVVLEEFTGYTCGNCPLGIIAIEKMEQVFGPQFIPIAIHGYDGDAWGAGMQGYYGHLGLMAAPSGIVNRSGTVSFPMDEDEDTFEKIYTNGRNLWYDLVSAELNIPTDIDISAKLGWAEGEDMFTVHPTVRCAINSQAQNLNIFMVLMEDGLVGIQDNYFASETDAVLGEWGQGGSKGKGKVEGVVYNDVVRTCYGNSFAGTGGLLPQKMTAGQEYTTSLQGVIPGTIDKVGNCKVAILLIDANTDRVVNACVVKFKDADVPVNTAKAQTNARQKTYNLQGVEVNEHYHGIVIRGGRKILQ